jgi:hypothetical protein
MRPAVTKMLPPDNWYDPIVLPGILTFIGAFIYWLGWLNERNGKSVSWKWIAVVFFLIAMFLGFGMMSRMSDPIYAQMIPKVKRWVMPHYLAFFLPLFGLIAAIVLHFMPRKPAGTPAPQDS